MMDKDKIPVISAGQNFKPEQQALGGGLEGAERTTREMALWMPSTISPNKQMADAKPLADARAQDMVQNDGYAMGAVATHKDSIVGAQYRLNAKPNMTVLGISDEKWEQEFREIAEARFTTIAESEENWLDASRMNTFTGLIRLAVGGHLMTGEVLATAEWLKAGFRRPCRTAIQMVAPIRLSNPDGQADNRFLKSGIVVDEFGAPQGYHIRKAYPGDESEPTEWGWKYVPATLPWGRRQVIHIIEQMLPSQSRGISDMVAALKQMRMTRNFQEIVLQNAVVNASYAAAIESELPSDVVFGQLGVGTPTFQNILGDYMTSLMSYAAGAKNIAIDGVKIPHLFPGTKLKMQPLGTPGGIGSTFEESLLRHISASLGLSYEQFTHDYTKTNYSSARASMGETHKFMQSRKKSVADRTASNIYALVLEEEIAAGNIPLPAGKSRDWFYEPLVKEALCRADWIGASRGQVDEKKETDAALSRIAGGLSTWEIETARLGYDFREIFKQRQREQKMMTDLGLVFNMNQKQAADKGDDPEGDPPEDDKDTSQ